jgi:hypothetical protein
MRMALTDPETCSWCTEEVEDEELTMTSDGRLCATCTNTDEGQKALLRYISEASAEEKSELAIEWSLYENTSGFFQ